MKPETIKYLKKRRKIIDIICNIEIIYENDDVYIETNPDFWGARDAAEEILNIMGISKPKEVEEKEYPGYSIG